MGAKRPKSLERKKGAKPEKGTILKFEKLFGGTF